MKRPRTRQRAPPRGAPSPPPQGAPQGQIGARKKLQENSYLALAAAAAADLDRYLLSSSSH